MGHYNNATICLNGHVVSKYQANYQKFCSKCGKETYSKCPECNSPIHGKYEVDGIVDLSGSYNRPDYCYNCGAPYPWTKIILDNAVMLVSLEDELDMILVVHHKKADEDSMQAFFIERYVQRKYNLFDS